MAGALTAFLLDLPFPLAGPLPIWRGIFAWFALVPLLVALLRLPRDFAGRSCRWQLGWSFLAGWFTGAIWFGANCYWVYDTMHLYGGMDKPMAVICLLAFSLYLGFWFGAFALALTLVRRATINRKFAWISVAAIPFLWTAMEFGLARIPQFPWDQLGYSQVDSGLLTRIAPWAGVYGISFVLAAGNAWITELFRRGRAFGFGGSLFTLFFIFCLSFGGSGAVPPATQATAVLVQPNLNVDTDDVWAGQEWDRHIAQFGQLGAQSCKSFLAGVPETDAQAAMPKCVVPPLPPSLVVWPESPAPFRDTDPRFRAAMRSIAVTDKAPMIVGAVGMDDDPAARQYLNYNSAVVVGQDGHFAGRYDKIHLVPFGEYVPFRKLLFFIHQITQTLTDMSTGTERKVFLINGPSPGAPSDAGHRYGVFICYEAVFGDEIRQFARNGAEVLVNISDDGWYGDTSAPWQHLNMARMRAIENRRWILGDTNNGVTAAIDPYGTVRQSIPRHAVDALPAQYGYISEMTFYTVHGDWLAWICAVIALGTVGWATRILLYS